MNMHIKPTWEEKTVALMICATVVAGLLIYILTGTP
jgi:hypothetical protein